jgi:hypothetical protein
VADEEAHHILPEIASAAEVVGVDDLADDGALALGVVVVQVDLADRPVDGRASWIGGGRGIEPDILARRGLLVSIEERTGPAGANDKAG